MSDVRVCDATQGGRAPKKSKSTDLRPKGGKSREKTPERGGGGEKEEKIPSTASP